MKLAVFASTKGTDLQAILDAISAGELPGVELVFVLSNKKNCYALERARLAGVRTYFVSVKRNNDNQRDPSAAPQDDKSGGKDDSGKKTREEYDAECLELCREHGVGLIFLIGYMRLLSAAFVEAYRGRILNVHPSLLPEFPGMDLDVHQAVLDADREVTGCTVHEVDEGMDTGKIVLQREVSVAPGETPESLKEKVQAEEKVAVVEVIRSFVQKKSDPPCLMSDLFE